jgi:hypothetical protein
MKLILSSKIKMSKATLCTDLLGYILDCMELDGGELVEMSKIERFSMYHLSKRLEEFKITYNHFLTKVKNRYVHPSDIPKKFWTKELTLAYLEKRAEWIDVNIIPVKFRSPEFYLECVKRNGCSLKIIPEKDKTSEMYFQALKTRGQALKFIPEEFKTLELCMMALQDTAYAFKFFPEEFKTLELCFEAVSKYKVPLKYIPEEYDNDEIIINAVQNNGNDLGYVHPDKRTYWLCLQSLRSNGSIRHIPSKYYDKNMLETAYTFNPRSLDWVPSETLRLYGF